MTTSSIFDVAAKGYKVFPFDPATGKSWGKDPASWATTTPPAEWATATHYGILGSEDVLGVDMDRHDGGADGLAAYEAAFGDLPDPEHSKPSNGGKGLHSLFRVTPEQRARIGAHTVGFLPGVDAAWNIRCRADMDYSHLPPVHELPPAPEELVAKIEAKRREKKPSTPLTPGQTHPAVAAAMRTPIPRGEQWTTLLAYAAHMAANGVAPEIAREAFAAALGRCESVSDEAHAWTAFSSAYEGRFYQEAMQRKEEDAWWAEIIASVQADEAARRGAPAQPIAAVVPEEKPDLFVDMAALLSGTLPPAPTPSILASGQRALFYEGKYNVLFGDPESGKTWVALAAVVEQIKAGRQTVVVDMDHNGASETASRLILLGATVEELSKPDLFAYTAPEDGYALLDVVQAVREMDQALVVLDSVGEIMASFGKDSNKDDDFTWVHQHVFKPLVVTGATVVAIDHLAKGEESRKKGPSGAVAKRRVIDGASLMVQVTRAWVKGAGGRSAIVHDKDRHGGLQGRRGEAVANFELLAAGGYKVWPVLTAEQTPEEASPLVGSTKARIINMLTLQAGQRATAVEIAGGIQMPGQQLKGVKKSVSNELANMFDEKGEPRGPVQREQAKDARKTWLYWVDIQE